MKSSLITKKRIAKSLKQLMQKKEFDEVSITEIMRESDIRRQTFYNYFMDKYELLEWIFETELREQVSDNLDYISSQQLIEQLLIFLNENQLFYKKLFELHGQNSFDDYFSSYCASIIEKYLSDQIESNELLKNSTKERFVYYHSLALSAYIQKKLPCSTLEPKKDSQFFMTIFSNSLNGL